MAAPFNPFSDYFKENYADDYERGYTQHATSEKFVTPQCLTLIEKVQNFVLSYVRDDSDAMTDYFDRNIYDRYCVGKFDKPFQLVEQKKAKIRKGTEPDAKTAGLQIVNYSAKALAVIGNTKEVKDTLKKLGGKFNSRLSCGAGWIFSKKRESELRALIAGK